MRSMMETAILLAIQIVIIVRVIKPIVLRQLSDFLAVVLLLIRAFRGE